MKQLLILFFWCLGGALAFGQPDYHNNVYAPHIKTVTMTVNGGIQSIPVFRLNSNDFLVLTFDDLSESQDDYFYRIVHCDKDWNKSDILEITYLDGFNDEPIRVWEFSSLTEVPYTHYWIQLPNRDTRFKISGNYLIYLYQNIDGEEVPIFTRRFIISEDGAGSQMEYVRNTSSYGDRFNQQFDVTVAIPSEISNPMSDIYTTIVQNGQWEQALTNIKKFNVNNSLMRLDPFGSVSFPGMTEFRNFDTRIKYGGGRHVESVNLKYGKTEVFLYPDYNRSRTPYLNNFDFNGNFYIDANDAARNTSDLSLQKDETSFEVRSSFSYGNRLIDGEYTFLSKDIRADYMEVNFRLKSEYLDKDVYIFGGLSDWTILPEFKMEYDFGAEEYRGKVLLKQGFYDYIYVTRDGDTIDHSRTEGSWFETENEYSIIVYYREFARRYDRVLSVSKINTLNLIYRN